MADFTNTLSAAGKVLPTNQEKHPGGFTHKYTILYSDVVNASATGSTDTVTVTLDNSPADFVVGRCVANVVTAFAGAGGLAMEVGTDGDPDNFITTTSVLTAGPIITAQGGIVETQAGSFAAASDVLAAKFTCSVSGSPSALTAGQVDIYLEVLGLNDLF